MNEREPEEFDAVVRRLRDHREELDALELDAIKTRAKRRADAPHRKGNNLRTRATVALATLGLMVAGTGGVIAAAPDKAAEAPIESAAKKQYKPGYGPCKQGSTHTGPPGQDGSNCETDPPPPGK